jgi:hypothetical protein
MNVQEQIITLVDKYLQWQTEAGLNKLPMPIQPEMADSTQNPQEEWRVWFPIASQVTNEEIADHEEYIGYTYPDSYKAFLKHKHFYDLQIAEVGFCRHPVHVWRGELSGMIYEGYPREFLIDRGLIPFASYSDWGMVCFDTSKRLENGEYLIILWDHERAYESEPLHNSFLELLIGSDKADKNFG